MRGDQGKRGRGKERGEIISKKRERRVGEDLKERGKERSLVLRDYEPWIKWGRRRKRGSRNQQAAEKRYKLLL